MSWMAAAVIGSAVVGAGVGAYGANKQAGAIKEANQASIDAAKMDPRLESIVYGENGTGGLLSQYQALGQQPQMPGLQTYGNANDQYLGYDATQDRAKLRETAYGQMAGNIPYPTSSKAGVYGATPMQAAQVNAPAQNAIDLTSSYNSLISGAPGANPYLTGAIGKGINQSANAFGNMVSDATKATQDGLGNIRGNSVLANQYGGSRQGLAEGKAIESMNTQLARAAQQFGQGNTDAAVAAQAAAYDADRARQLAATQGLSGQQYGVAGQNAAMEQAARTANLGAEQQTKLAQAGYDDAAAARNLGAQLSTNSLNAANVQQGATNLSGLLGSSYGIGQDANSANINRALQVNGLLQPYLLKNNNVPAMQPTYSNTAGAALGGATAGLGLYNMYNQLGGGGSGMNWNSGTSSAAGYTPPTTVNTGLGGLLPQLPYM